MHSYQGKSADPLDGDRLGVWREEPEQPLALRLQLRPDRFPDRDERGESEGRDASLLGGRPGTGDEAVDEERLGHVAVLPDDDLAVLVADDAGPPLVAEQKAVPLGKKTHRQVDLNRR